MESIAWSVKDPEQFLECVISEQAEPANTQTWEDALGATSHQILHSQHSLTARAVRNPSPESTNVTDTPEE